MNDVMNYSGTAGYNFNNANCYTGGPVTSSARPYDSLTGGNSRRVGQQSLGNGQYSSTSFASPSNAMFYPSMLTGLLWSTTNPKRAAPSYPCFDMALPQASCMQVPGQTFNMQKDTSSGPYSFTNELQGSCDTHALYSCQFAAGQMGYNSSSPAYLNTHAQGQFNNNGSAQSQHQMMPAQYFNGLPQGQTAQYNLAQNVASNSSNTAPAVLAQVAPSQINSSTYVFDPAYIAQTQSNSAPVVHQGASMLVTQAPSGPAMQQMQAAIFVAMPQTGQPAKKGTRPPLSPEALDAMSAWFEDNQHHPYPSKENYKSFVAIGGTTHAQAVRWFANRRIRTGTCKSIPEYVQGRLVKPAKSAGSENHVPISIKRKKSHKNSDKNGLVPDAKKPRMM